MKTMVTTQKLVDSNKDKRLGNHRLRIVGHLRQYIYHNTIIIETDSVNKVIEINNGGWNTPSTNRAIKSYMADLDFLLARGYSIHDCR